MRAIRIREYADLTIAHAVFNHEFSGFRNFVQQVTLTPYE